MSKTLSVLIVENFVITEGPKWHKFKSGAIGDKGKKNKQTNKSLKERLNLVKSGMFLNEEPTDTITLIELEKKKERESDGHTPESIANIHNVPLQDILDQIEKGIEVEREHTTDKDEARLIAMDHLVELPDYYTRLDKMEEEGLQELEQEKKSLKERLNLVKSGMFLNEEPTDITALRNKINQGLILLPGLKGPAADRMEDSIRGWEDQIKELEKKTTKTLEEASGVERDIKFLTKETAFSYTTDSLFANIFLMFRMNNKKSNLPIGTMPSKNTGVIAGLLGGAIGGGLSAIDNMEKYFKSDKLQSDKEWFYKNIAQKGTRVRDSIENFKNIRSSELSNAKKGNRADLKKVKRAWADAHKSIRDSLNLFNKEHIKQEKK